MPGCGKHQETVLLQIAHTDDQWCPMPSSHDLCEEIVRALRRVMRAVDLHSRGLVRSHGLTSTQALLLKELLRMGETSVGELARVIALSPATVTDVLNRLEKRGLVARMRSPVDRRQVLVRATQTTAERLSHSPPLLQERFAEKLLELQEWEQTQLLASLQRLAAMMDAEGLDAAPVLSGDVLAEPCEESGVADLMPAVQGGQVSAGIEKNAHAAPESAVDEVAPIDERAI